jgi:predicted transcriptional regulator
MEVHSLNSRQKQILQLILKERRIAVSTLADFIGVSAVTIRKDLTILTSLGLIQREHGFAEAPHSTDTDSMNQNFSRLSACPFFALYENIAQCPDHCSYAQTIRRKRFSYKSGTKRR